MQPNPDITWYLAGPMTRIPQCNFPAFIEVAGLLRANGYKIISPAELDDPDTRAAAMANMTGEPITNGHTWGDFLSRDVKVIADKVNGIILMDRWATSRGAKLEVTVGLLCGHQFARFYQESKRLAALTRDYVAFTMAEELGKNEPSNRRQTA